MVRLLALLTLIGSLTTTRGGIWFGFWLESNAYNSTDMVVATEGDRIDGELTVLEVWKGTLHPGDKVHVPELAAFTNADLRTVGGTGAWRKWSRPHGDTNAPVVVSGQRMILFLKAGSADATDPLAVRDSTAPTHWKGAAGFNGMQTSTAWVEGNQVYTFSQPMNPGPLVLLPDERSETEMKHRALQVAYERTALEDISKTSNALVRARLAAPFVNSNGLYSTSSAFAILSGCGADGILVLRKMLKDPASTNLYGSVLAALAHARDPAVVPELRRVLQEELQFWKENGPRLPLDWWDKDYLKGVPVRLCRERYGQTLGWLRELWLVRLPELDPLVAEIRECWLSMPNLEDSLKAWSSEGHRVGHSQIVEQADRILARPK